MSKNIKKQSLQYGTVIMLASAVLVKLIGALFKIPLAGSACLGDLGFGYFSSAYDLYIPIYSLAISGLPVATARIVAEHMAAERYKDVKMTLKLSRRIYFAAGLTACIIMLALVYPFVSATDKTGKTVYSLFMIAPSMLCCAVISAYRGYYEGLKNMYPTAISQLIEALCKLIFGFGFAYFTVKITGDTALGAAAAMLGITLGTLLAVIFLRLYHKRFGDGISEEALRLSPSVDNTKSSAKKLLIIALPIALAALCNNAPTVVDALTVRRQLSELIKDNVQVIREMYGEAVSAYNTDTASVLTDGQLPTFLYGIRGKAYTLFNLVPSLTAVIGVAAVPVIAEYSQKRDIKGIKINTESVLKLSAVISFPVAAGFVAIGEDIMRLLYSTRASSQIGGTLLTIFGFAVIFAGTAVPLNGILQAFGKQKSVLLNIAAAAVVKTVIGAVTVGNPKININGAAASTLGFYITVFSLDLITLRRTAGFLPGMTKTFLKPLMAAGLCGVTAWLVSLAGENSIVVCLSVFSAAAVYFLSLILLNTFDENDFSGIPKGKNIVFFCKKHRIIR